MLDHELFMRALSRPGDYADSLQSNLRVIKDACDDLGVATEHEEADFPTLSLPVFSFAFKVPEEDNGRTETSQLNAFKRVTQRAVKDYVQAYSGTRTLSFKSYRKQFLKHIGDTGDFLILSIYLANLGNRHTVLQAWLDGHQIPVIEIDILERWKAYFGDTSDTDELITLRRDRALLGKDIRRAVALEGYLNLVFRVAEQLHVLRQQGSEADSQAVWLTFNAWWALGSLANNQAILSDFRHLWPEAFSLMSLISDIGGMGGSMMIRSSMSAPAMPGADLSPISTLMREGQWLSQAPNLLGKWREAIPRVARLQTAIEQLKRSQAAAIPENQYETLKMYACAPSSDDGTPWEAGALSPGGIPPLGLELLAKDLAAFNDGTSPEDLVEAVDVLLHYADLLGGWIRHLQSGGVCLYQLKDGEDAAPASITPDEFDVDAPLVPSDLCMTLPLVTMARDLVARSLQNLNNEITQIHQNAELSLAERLRRTQEIQDKLNGCWRQHIDENVTPILDMLDKVEWNRLSLVPLVEPVSTTEEGEDAELRERLADAQRENENQEARIKSLEEALSHSEEEGAALRENIATLSSHAEPLPAQSHNETLIAAVTAFGQTSSAPDALRLASACRPERLRVLDSAYASARDAASSLSGSGLLRKLMALVEDGWEALAAGKPLYSLQQVVPGHLACLESDRVTQHPKLRDERVFIEKANDGTRRWEMQSHITLDERHRLYFAWDEAASQFVIGHAGRHLSIATAS